MSEKILREQSPALSAESPVLTYRTNNLHFSVWLIVENLLPYERCAVLGRQALFVFRDPEGRGGELHAQWLSSNPLLPQKTVSEILRMLRTEMASVLRQGGAHEIPA